MNGALYSNLGIKQTNNNNNQNNSDYSNQNEEAFNFLNNNYFNGN